MEANGTVLCDNLIKWLQTLDLKAKHGNPSGKYDFSSLNAVRSSYITMFLI